MTKPFEGFDPPHQNWSKLPHQMVNALPLVETLGEMKVILYVLRHTWGFQEFEDWQVKKITTDEFMHGRKRRDGTRLDGGIGMSKPTLYRGLDRAVEHGFLVKYVDNTDLGRVTHYYRLRQHDDEKGTVYATDPDRKGTSPWNEIDPGIKKRVYERFGGRCAYCEQKSRKWHYDHIVPKSRGGPDDFDNLALACPKCNMTKGDRTPDEWGRAVIYYDENDVKKRYMGWSCFMPGGGNETIPRTEKDTLERNHGEDPKGAKPDPESETLPYNLDDWIEFVKEGKGQPGGMTARLGRMFMTLYPVYEPDYGRIGSAARRVGGARRLAHLCWLSQGYRVTGDPVSYCEGMHKGKKRDERKHNGNRSRQKEGSIEPGESYQSLVERGAIKERSPEEIEALRERLKKRKAAQSA